MTTIRDFQQRSMDGDLPPPVMPLPSLPPHHHAHSTHHHSTPSSPEPHDRSMIDRRGSVVSHQSARSSRDGMRHRRVERSNTVTSYVQPDHDHGAPGAEPGIDTKAEDENLPQHLAKLKARCVVNIIDFSDEDIRFCTADNDTLAACLAEPRPDELPCRWISVNGLSWDVIKSLGNRYSLHRLAIEDLIHLHTRTKVDCTKAAMSDATAPYLKILTSTKRDHQESPESRPKVKGKWWQRTKRGKSNLLPQYVDGDGDGEFDEMVHAHSGISDDSPITPIRTLHRYEGAMIPEHTAFMEKHSVLAEEDLVVSVEQVSLFLLADNTVISFFEHSADDVEAPILERLQSTETMLRRSCDASLMLQAIIDAIVDLGVPVKDAYNKSRKELQVDAMTTPDIKTSRALHIFGEEIDMLQNLFKPIVLLVHALRDHNNVEPLHPSPPTSQQALDDDDNYSPRPNGRTRRDGDIQPQFVRKLKDYKRTATKHFGVATSVSISPLAQTYFGDVLDHAITMIQGLEQMDASANNISALVFNTVGAKTNNFLMVLAIVTVFFAPLTFISGYFGQNFSNGSGLDHPFSFFFVVAVPSVVGFMLLVFAYMFRDWLKASLARRGFKLHRRRRRRGQRVGMR